MHSSVKQSSFRLHFLRFMVLTFAFISSSCGVVPNGSSNLGSIEGRISPTYTGPSEQSYCSNITSYGGSPITITGDATYQEREAFDNGGGDNGLGAASTARPIRFAEVRVVNSSGTTIQCSETDISGNFSFLVPSNPSNYTVYINSRANNSDANVSVLVAPENNNHYSISKTFLPDSTKNIGNINAPVTGAILGAAFHMLDLVVAANIFLRNEVGSCSADVVGCIDFTTAPKVSIYWEKGYNPNSYLGSPNSGLSFYLPDFSRLFILGGINGDTDSSDTDHFDDSIVLHEYGHFLEDLYSKSDSPGGAHSGQRPIDPRLALSEAWGNFIQAAVIGGASETSPKYTDTRGNTDGDTSFLLSVPIEAVSGSCAGSPNLPGCDEPSVVGEGDYREFAITRFLWDIFDSVSDGETITNGFKEIWASITQGNGYFLSNKRFRSLGLVNDLQQNLSDGVMSPITNWSVARGLAENRVDADRTSYAQYLATGSSCGTRNFNLVPLDEAGDFDEFATSNLFYNNDFYHFIQSSTGPATFILNYQTSSGIEADLDLFIYNESANFGLSTDIVGQAKGDPSTGASGNIETETVTISSLPAGHYLINVKVETVEEAQVGASTDYELYLGGSQLCPTALP